MGVSECEFSQSYGATVSYEGHRDLGNGFVMYVERYEEADSGTLVLANCGSGLTLIADTSGVGLRRATAMVLKPDPKQRRATLSDLQKRFSGLGMWTNLISQSTEHCACAAFYPESKGTKDHWKKRYEHP